MLCGHAQALGFKEEQRGLTHEIAKDPLGHTVSSSRAANSDPFFSGSWLMPRTGRHAYVYVPVEQFLVLSPEAEDTSLLLRARRLLYDAALTMELDIGPVSLRTPHC